MFFFSLSSSWYEKRLWKTLRAFLGLPASVTLKTEGRKETWDARLKHHSQLYNYDENLLNFKIWTCSHTYYSNRKSSPFNVGAKSRVVSLCSIFKHFVIVVVCNCKCKNKTDLP